MTFFGEDDLKLRAITAGRSAFGASWTPAQWAIGPGRLELLGNHVDYNGGLVLAGAIDRAVLIGVGTTDAPGTIHVVASDVSSEPTSLEIAALANWHVTTERGPIAYASGVIAALRAREIPIRDGLALSIVGNVPLGFGMSSSAGLCVALVLALAEDAPSPRDVVLIAQDAEHRAGAPVGAMDQSASVAGGIIIFDGSDISFRQITPDLGDYVFAVADSRVEHANATSSYPTRVKESQAALAILRDHVDPELASLGAITDAQWATIATSGDAWLDATLMRRTRHVVTEMTRVREGIVAVERGDWARFGALMQASGQSSATDYEISHPLVEELVAEITAVPGVLGARMMGGGEGGPALALLHRDAVPEVAARLREGYFTRHPAGDPGDRFQVCIFANGARVITAA